MEDTGPQQDATEPSQGVTGPSQRYVGGAKGAKKASRLLRDYRWVYSHPKKSDDTEGRKTLRKQLDSHPTHFLAQMARLEGELSAKQVKGVVDAGPAAMVEVSGSGDAGTTRALELIDKLLDEWDTSRGNG